MQAKTKERIKAILFYQPTNKELSDYTGKKTSHIATVRANHITGNASTFGVINMRYKLEQVLDVTKDKSVLEIIDAKYTNEELALNSGLNLSVINNLKRYDTEKAQSYGYEYHVLALKIENLANLVE